MLKIVFLGDARLMEEGIVLEMFCGGMFKFGWFWSPGDPVSCASPACICKTSTPNTGWKVQ
jgi:hypothetical protein